MPTVEATELIKDAAYGYGNYTVDRNTFTSDITDADIKYARTMEVGDILLLIVYMSAGIKYLQLELLCKSTDKFFGTIYTYQLLKENKEPTSTIVTASDIDLITFSDEVRMRKFKDEEKSGGYSKRTNRRTKRSTKRHTKRRSRHSRRK
jgi:hypothetical protein